MGIIDYRCAPKDMVLVPVPEIDRIAGVVAVAPGAGVNVTDSSDPIGRFIDACPDKGKVPPASKMLARRMRYFALGIGTSPMSWMPFTILPMAKATSTHWLFRT